MLPMKKKVFAHLIKKIRRDIYRTIDISLAALIHATAVKMVCLKGKNKVY